MNMLSTSPKRGTDQPALLGKAEPRPEVIASLEGTVPSADRLSFRSMISSLVSHAMGALSRSSDTSDRAACPATEVEKEAVTQTRESFFSRLFSGMRRGLFLALDTVVELTRYLADLLSTRSRSVPSVTHVSTPTDTPHAHHGPPSNRPPSNIEDGHKAEAYTAQKTEADKACATVADATRRKAEKKHEEKLHEAKRETDIKEAAERQIDRIDLANGITNVDVAIIKANLEGSYGSASTAIRAIIEAQAREPLPQKKPS